MSWLPQDNQLYMSRVRDTTWDHPGDTATFLPRSDISGTKSYFLDSNAGRHGNPLIPSLAEIETLKTEARHGPTVCILENVLPERFKVLESKWNLDPDFLAFHISDRPREWTSPWPPPRIYKGSQYLSDRTRDFRGLPGVGKNPPPKFYDPKKWDYIDGVFEYHDIHVNEQLLEQNSKCFSSPNHVKRDCFYTNWYGRKKTLCSDTRISYYMVDDSLYLFLIDAPLCLQDRYRHKDRHVRPTLRLPYAVNWGGIFLPQLLSKENGSGGRYSLCESLVNLFKYRWQRELLFEHERRKFQAFPAPPLCYMLLNSLWWSNLDHLTKKINRISFRELRNPHLEINEPLHDLREDLVDFMNTGLSETETNIPKSIRKFWEDQRKFSQISQDRPGENPISGLNETRQKAEKLERFLMHTFQILMSSVGIQDARKVSQLTNFATVFLPLSFVADVFGMNLKELNNSVLPSWVFIVVAIAVVFAAFMMFRALRKISNIDWRNCMRPWRTENRTISGDHF